MGSIRIIYDAEGDILDVDFRLTGEKPQQGIELHDNITLWTDAEGNIPLRLMLLSYSKLLEQPGLLFSNLKKLSSQKRASLLDILKREPLRHLLSCVDEKELRFRVIEPKVRELAAA